MLVWEINLAQYVKSIGSCRSCVDDKSRSNAIPAILDYSLSYFAFLTQVLFMVHT